jgi:putative Ca2+/H+ antiporter (TMEM165/GDT1 family)
MEALFISTLVVALAEIGDKTQLLSLFLAARYRRPGAIILGIFVATLANHALAGLAGAWVRSALGPEMLRWLLGGSLLVIAAWTLKPDRLDEDPRPAGRYGVLVITVIAFFLAEMGDKTQVATVVLAAQYAPLAAVVVGTTLGMMLANAPVVLLGSRFSSRIPYRAVRYTAAALFAVLGVLTLAGVGQSLG